MINEDAKISHTFRAQREAPGRTGKPNSSAPDTAYAVQPAIFRLAPVPPARSTLLMHFQRIAPQIVAIQLDQVESV